MKLLRVLAHRLSPPISIALGLALSLSGCGFQPAMPFSPGASLQPIAVEGDLRLAKTLRNTLKQEGLNISSTRSNARSIIRVRESRYDSLTYTLAIDGRAAEVRQLFSANASWSRLDSGADEAPLLAERRFTREVIRVVNLDNAAANQREAQLMNSELEQRLAEAIVDAMQIAEQQYKPVGEAPTEAQ